ncbi:Radical SAM superfamily enzyme, MoaA/NifB/PqqE/SkfB family [Salinimicrobium sediminis]|uniref:Radical SAM superfamily enzyme, MoaA/NifB/PqqE/SkfB family n=1 Tax=Salinimicrobium sediminis TaxID=1343891 RepID=A0A285X5D1_9FLAO|nr:radical SAM protein [Salinimicrobium sediminis]SOC80478.1 Radical SAM superfamily enzyme, MoaA/NifB/PqqE/SkfB family [Salinimicrobium sediminis]
METENLITARPLKRVPVHPIEASPAPVPSNLILSGWRKRYIHSRMVLSLIKLAWESYGNTRDVFRGLQYLVRLRKNFFGDTRLKKIAYANRQYYLSLYNPGWNGDIFRKFMQSQLNDYKPVKQKINRFNNVIIAITKKCSLQCDHCFEWESLNKKESLSTADFIGMVEKLQKQGVSEIQFSGGEPMLKVDRILEILNHAEKRFTSFWIDTSGFKFTAENARRLKEAGLTGIIVSLDHFDPAVRNKFRGFKNAFYWAETAVKNALEQDFVVTLSLCITREFATKENLLRYMQMARKMGVAFVQFLEPKAVGHYRGKDVLLQPEQIAIIEKVYLEMNFSNNYLSYPIVTYHGFYHRRSGCFSGGYKGFYVDTDGDINPCPFCRKKSGNLKEQDLDLALNNLRNNACSDYATFSPFPENRSF